MRRVVRLARVGIENVKGYLEGGVQSWRDAGLPVETIPQLSVAELKEQMANNELQIVDVRRPGEYVNGHVPRALNAPLASLDKSLGPLPLREKQANSGYLRRWVSLERGGEFVAETRVFKSPQCIRRYGRVGQRRVSRGTIDKDSGIIGDL